jgi:hypothetical protein
VKPKSRDFKKEHHCECGCLRLVLGWCVPLTGLVVAQCFGSIAHTLCLSCTAVAAATAVVSEWFEECRALLLCNYA